MFNVGVIEHFLPEGQLAFLKRMKIFSKKFVAIGIPDYNSPIFKSFLNYFYRVNKENTKEHLEINVLNLFKKTGISFLDKIGLGIGISSKEINFKDPTLLQFLSKILDSKDLKNFTVNHNMVDWLIKKELSLSKQDRDIFGFLDIYLGKV